MKNKKWIILIVVILLLLVVPIPTGTYKDGGTKTYTALTYKIVDWNHIYDAGNIYDKTKIYPFPMNFMSLDSLLDREEEYFETSGTTKSGKSVDEIDVDAYDFSAQYIRTDGYHEEFEYPIVKIIRSVDELNAYYDANKDIYDLGRKDKVYSDTAIGFLDACDKYDAAYFEEQILVMVLLEEGSGSNRHKVKNVALTGANGTRQMVVDIETIIPDACTDDMAEWHILIEPEAGIDVVSEEDITVFLDGVNETDKPTVAEYSKGYANMSLMIPDGWEYEMFDANDGSNFGISIWPAGHSDGKLKLEYYVGTFVVCGTGLEQKKITLGGYEVYQGTYDNKNGWDFLHLVGTPGDYVVINEGADSWWSEYGDEAMDILGTMTVGEGVINEAQATEIAKQKKTVEYDQVRAAFNYEEGVWTVYFYKDNTAGGDQKVKISANGSIIDITYGE